MSQDNTADSTRDVVGPAEWIARIYARLGVPIERARDLVILRCLEAGDVTAFSYFVLAGHQPGKEVLRTMAFMAAEEVPAAIAEVAPFKLGTKRRQSVGPGRRVDPLIVMRDEAIELNVLALIDSGLSRDAATAVVAEMCSDKQEMQNGRSRRVETIRKARKRRKSQGS